MRKKPSIYFLVIFSVLLIASKFILPQKNFISYDNFGYYMHLPAKYVYHDVALKTEWYKQVNEKYKVSPTFFQIAQSEKGGMIMRFYKGMSYLWTPAFFAADQYAKANGYPADGFSKPYPLALILFGALFSIIGLIYTRKILLHYFNEKVTTLTLVLIFLGTNILYFATIGNDTPHVYLFTLFVAFLWYNIRWYETFRMKFAIAMGIVLGFIIAIRPSDIFILAFPFLWGVYNLETLKWKFMLIKKYILQIILAGFIAGLFFVPQLLYYRVYAGEFFLNIYNDPGAAFDFLHPRFGYVLLGFRKGWFIYSPLSVLGFIGLIFVYQKFREYFWPAVIYLALVIYLIASFNSLVSYGWRGFIQAYATLVIPTGFFVQYMLKRPAWIKALASILILFLMCLNILKAYQVQMGVIDGSRMTRDYYLRVLFKTKVTEEDRRLLMVERSLTAIDVIPDYINYNNVLLFSQTFDDKTIIDTIAPQPYEGAGMLEMNQGVMYSPDFKKPYKDITKEYYCYVRAIAYVFAWEDVTEDLLLVITTLNKNDEHIKYRALSFNQDNKFIPGKWNRLILDYQTPEIYSGNEKIQSMVWYRGKGRVWVDNFKVIAYTIDGL